MAGRLTAGAMMSGLPGNPGSAMVCGQVFLAPVLRAMLGLGQAPAPELTAPLAEAIQAHGPREHYMRGRLENGALTVFDRQDSSLLSVLAGANVLVIRPPNDPARAAGDMMRAIAI
jgi:molybdopterin molybdotransferase